MINQNPTFQQLALSPNGRTMYALSDEGGIYRVSNVTTERIEIQEMYHPKAVALEAAEEEKAQKKEKERVAKSKKDAKQRAEEHQKEQAAERIRKAKLLLEEAGELDATKEQATSAGEENTEGSSADTTVEQTDESASPPAGEGAGEAEDVDQKPGRSRRSRRAKNTEPASEETEPAT